MRVKFWWSKIHEYKLEKWCFANWGLKTQNLDLTLDLTLEKGININTYNCNEFAHKVGD